MGTVIHALCGRCGYETEIFAGGGLSDCNLDTMLDALPEDGRRALSLAVERGASGLDINRIPCRCALCGALYARAVVRYRLDGKQSALLGLCPNCGGNASRALPENGAADGCPRCGGEILLRPAGHWD